LKGTEEVSLQRQEYLSEELGTSQVFKEKRKKRRETENEGGVWKGNKNWPFLVSFNHGHSAAAAAGSWPLPSWRLNSFVLKSPWGWQAVSSSVRCCRT